MTVWTKEQSELYSWRHRHKIALATFIYYDHIECWIQYGVGKEWPSESIRLWIFNREIVNE